MMLVTLALAAVLGMQEAPADAIDGFIRDLGSTDAGAREAAGRALRKIGAPAVPALQKAVGDFDPGRAEQASLVLQEIEKRTPVEPEAPAVAAPQQPPVQEGFALQVAAMVIENEKNNFQDHQKRLAAFPILRMNVIPVAVPQEAKPDDKDPAAADVATALRKTAQSGFAFKGEIAADSTDAAAGLTAAVLKAVGMSKGEPVVGKLSGTVGAPFQVAVRVKFIDGSYEMFRTGDRTVERLTRGAGMIDTPLDAAVQALLVFNLEDLAKSVETLATRVKAGGESQVDDMKCRRFDISLPEEAFPRLNADGEDPITANIRKSSAPERTVDIMAWVGVGDGQVRRLQAVFHYKQKLNGRGFSGDINYDATLTKHGAAEVLIPADVKEE